SERRRAELANGNRCQSRIRRFLERSLGQSGGWKDDGDDGGGPFAVIGGVGAAHPHEGGSGIIPFGNDGAEIVVGGVARDGRPGPFGRAGFAGAAKKFVVPALVGLTDERSAGYGIGVGRNVSDVRVFRIESTQTRVVIFARI